MFSPSHTDTYTHTVVGFVPLLQLGGKVKQKKLKSMFNGTIKISKSTFQ